MNRNITKRSIEELAGLITNIEYSKESYNYKVVAYILMEILKEIRDIGGGEKEMKYSDFEYETSSILTNFGISICSSLDKRQHIVADKFNRINRKYVKIIMDMIKRRLGI